MADENKGQEPEQEQGQEQEPVQEPEEEQGKEKPAKEKGEGLLMPILYALLAAAGAFTLVMIAGIVLTILFRPAEPEETPPAGATPPAQIQTLAPEGE